MFSLRRLPREKYNHKIYALTEQKKNYNKLQGDRILGLAEIEKTNETLSELHFLQVNPDFNAGRENPGYRYVGTGIINALKKVLNSAITVRSIFSATNFYECNGFELTDPKNYEYIWRAAAKKV